MGISQCGVSKTLEIQFLLISLPEYSRRRNVCIRSLDRKCDVELPSRTVNDGCLECYYMPWNIPLEEPYTAPW